MVLFYTLGKTNKVSLSSKDTKRYGLNGDGEFSAPSSKTVHVTTVQANETQENVTDCELE